MPERRTTWALRELVVLHEVAHHLCDSDPPHGPEFVATFCELAAAVMGPEVAHVLAGRLREGRGALAGNVGRVSEAGPRALDDVFNRVLRHRGRRAARRRAKPPRPRACRRSRCPHNTAKLLSLLAAMHGASRVLEIGTLAGYSTINLARGVGPTAASSHSNSSRHADVARASLARAGVADRVEVIVGET